jgi:pilus assembly protein CpaC
VASFIDTLRTNDAAFEVIVGQERILTLKNDTAPPGGSGVIAVADPSIVDFEVLPNPRLIRLTGKRPGVTDLTVSSADGQFLSFQINVVYDLELLRAHLRQAFPDAALKVAQMREHLVIEGEARTTAQVNDILTAVDAYLGSLQPANQLGAGLMGARASAPAGNDPGAAGMARPAMPPPNNGAAAGQVASPAQASPPIGGRFLQGAGAKPRIINLIRVPGVRQVMLQVRVAELNRTALRQIGADILGVDPSHGTIIGTSIAGATVSALGTLGLGGVAGTASAANGPTTTMFGISPSANFEIMLHALRENSLLSILAEPNLIAMDGHHASFLAGGQFPVPVPQGGGLNNSVTVEFKDFGVQLDFIPHVLDDNTIRLAVTPEVSSIDFTLGTTLVVGGTPVPGLNTRTATTTVELREGQTLAIAGLLQVEIDAKTTRIPGLGDLPVLGPMFSNTSHQRTEKELLVLVTPHLIAPMNQCQVPALPGADLADPTDIEFYLKNRIEGRDAKEYPSAGAAWDTSGQILLEQRRAAGPVGFAQ